MSKPISGKTLARIYGGFRQPRTHPWREAHRLAEKIRRDLPTDEWGRRQASREGHCENLLLHLADLGDQEEIDSFLTTQSAAGAYGVRDNQALIKALELLSPTRTAELISAILNHNASVQPVACSNLLARCTDARPEHRVSLRLAAEVLLQALPGDAPNPPAVNHGRQSEAPTSGMLADVLSALELIDGELANQALGHFLTNPATYSVDRLLLPAVQSLCASKQTRGLPTVHEMRGAVISHLQQRVAEPWSLPRTGDARAKSVVPAPTAGTSAAFSPIPANPFGCSRPPKRRAPMLNISFGLAIATWTVLQRGEAAPTPCAAPRTRPAINAGSNSGAEIWSICWNFAEAGKMPAVPVTAIDSGATTTPSFPR